MVNADERSQDAAPSRRSMLRAAAAALVAGVVRTGAEEPAASQPALAAAAWPARPWWLELPAPARVVQVRSGELIRGEVVDPVVATQAVRKGIHVLTDQHTERAAWREILGDVTRVTIKLNSVGAVQLGTSDAVCRTLVESLARAGWGPGDLTLVEAPDYLIRELGTRRPAVGWGGKIAWPGGEDELAAWWEEAEAVINVGLLKTHRIAGMSAAMKNISHAIIRHPARFHGEACAGCVAGVFGTPVVQQKLKLNVVNALRVVIANGPGALRENTVEANAVILGRDPVAVESAAKELLEAERLRAGQASDLSVVHLELATRNELGRGRSRDRTIVHVQA